MQERELRIRQLAHEIWESEGRPEGRHEEHWARAEATVAAEDQPPAAARPRSSRKPKAEGSETAPSRPRRKAAEAGDETAARPRKGKAASGAA